MKIVYFNTFDEMKVWIPKKAISPGASVTAVCPNCGLRQAIDAAIAEKYGEGNCAHCSMPIRVNFMIPDANWIGQNKQVRFQFYLN
jgi:hypothetical protein